MFNWTCSVKPNLFTLWIVSRLICIFIISYACSIVQYRVNQGEMDRWLALVWFLVVCQLLPGNRVRRRVEFQRRSKQLAAKSRAAWRRLKAKRCMHFATFLSVAVTYTTSTVSWSISTKERSFMWWDRIVCASFTEEDWLKNFSNVQGKVFVSLPGATTHHFKAWHRWERHCFVKCEWLSLCGSWELMTAIWQFRHVFGVSRSSVCLIVKEVCQAIVSKLLPIYIRILEGDALQEVMRQFQSKCFVRVSCNYYSRKGWHSVILQALVDHEYRFMNLSVGYPHKAHDLVI